VAGGIAGLEVMEAPLGLSLSAPIGWTGPTSFGQSRSTPPLCCRGTMVPATQATLNRCLPSVVCAATRSAPTQGASPACLSGA